MQYIKQFCVILGICFLSEILKIMIRLPIPTSIYGLLIMFGLLNVGIIKLESVETAGTFLIDIMPLMFIPAGVGLMDSFEFLKGIMIPIVVIVSVTTVIVMVVSGKSAQFILERHKNE